MTLSQMRLMKIFLEKKRDQILALANLLNGRRFLQKLHHLLIVACENTSLSYQPNHARYHNFSAAWEKVLLINQNMIFITKSMYYRPHMLTEFVHFIF